MTYTNMDFFHPKKGEVRHNFFNKRKFVDTCPKGVMKWWIKMFIRYGNPNKGL